MCYGDNIQYIHVFHKISSTHYLVTCTAEYTFVNRVKGNNSSTTDAILMKLYVHGLVMVIHVYLKFH